MKKILYGTTALASVGLVAGGAGDAAAAERIKMEVSGYHQQWVVGLDQDEDDLPPGTKTLAVDQKTNSEICFVGETTLDNGITVGVNVQLEGYNRDTGGADNTRFIDETFLYLQSEQLGQIKLGNDDAVTDQLHVSAPSGGISVDDGDVRNVAMYTTVINTGGMAVQSTSLGDDVNGDTNRIFYISPRYFGFQAGISYAPNASEDSNTTNSPLFGCNAVGVCPAGAYHDEVSGAINYRGAFSGVGVQLSAGVSNAQQVGLIADVGNEGTLFGYSVGGQLTFGGFTVGGAFKQHTSGRAPTGPGVPSFSLRGNSWSAGGRYEIGPYAAGISCVDGKVNGFEAPGSRASERLNCTLSGTYTLGPGIRLVGGFFYFDEEGSRRNAADGSFTDVSTDGWGGAVAITTSF